MPGDSAFWSSHGNHRPPHLYIAGALHMVTASLRDHAPRMAAPERKDGFCQLLGELCLECQIVIVAWVILNDHYHALLCPESADQMGRMLGRLHRISAGRWNREDGAKSRSVWYQHWDRVMRSEGDVYSRINYIHRNGPEGAAVRPDGGTSTAGSTTSIATR
jgi:REP element-mobilizing transposase RayT